jgi:hypothetical protein
MSRLRDEVELTALSVGPDFAEQFGAWVEHCHDEMCRSLGVDPATSKAVDWILGTGEPF